MAKFLSFFFFFFFFFFVQAEICVERDVVYPIVDRHVGYGVGIHDRTPWGRDMFVNRYGIQKTLDHNTDYYNRDIGLYKSWYPRNVWNQKWDRPIYGAGMHRTSLGRGIVDYENIYNRDLMHTKNYGVHNIFDYTNDVGEYVKTDINAVVKSEIDRSYRIDFFKGNFGNIKTRSECDCVCPNTIPRGDLTNQHVFEIVQKDLMNKLWNNRHMPKLSLLGKRMKFAILNLVNSDVDIYRKYSFIFSSFFFSHFQHLDVHTLCPFMKIVDLSVMYANTRDVSLLKELYEIIGLSIRESAKLNSLSSIYNSGCHVDVNVEHLKVLDHQIQCLDETKFLARLEELWAREGRLLPETVRHLVHDLWRSTYFPDKLMAVVATMVLTPEINTFLEDWNMYTWSENINILGTGIVPECCCSFRINRLHEILSINRAEILRNTERVMRIAY